MERLNDDVLVHLFRFCSAVDLNNLHGTCKRFHGIVELYFYRARCSGLLIVTHDKDAKYRNRSFGKLSFADRLYLHENWCGRRFARTSYLLHTELFSHRLQLDAETVYISNRDELLLYERRANDIQLAQRVGQEASASEIMKLALDGAILVGAKRNGRIFNYSGEFGFNEEVFGALNDRIHDVDCWRSFVCCASDQECKLLTLNEELGLLAFQPTHCRDEKWLGAQFSADGSKILLGNSLDGRIFIGLMDTETFQLQRRSLPVKHKEEFLQLKWTSPNSCLLNLPSHLLTQMDFREHQSATPRDITASAVTCFDFDGKHGVLCALPNGLLQLYDLRKPNKVEQTFELLHSHRTLLAGGGNSNGVQQQNIVCRDLIFDERHLFIATDHDVGLLNFFI